MEAGRKERMITIWGAYVHSKLKIFGWRLLQDKLSSRKQLLRRRIITQDQEVICVICNLQVEDINHLMLHCTKLNRLWSKVFLWLDLHSFTVDDCCSHLLKYVDLLKGKMSSNKVGVIWLTICWCIWKQKNDIFLIV